RFNNWSFAFYVYVLRLKYTVKTCILSFLPIDMLSPKKVHFLCTNPLAKALDF
ncbi:hypothetical protein X975_00466, partial [Stegodyphus mimosarum]